MKLYRSTYKQKGRIVDLGSILAILMGAAATFLLVRTANTILGLL